MVSPQKKHHSRAVSSIWRPAATSSASLSAPSIPPDHPASAAGAVAPPAGTGVVPSSPDEGESVRAGDVPIGWGRYKM